MIRVRCRCIVICLMDTNIYVNYENKHPLQYAERNKIGIYTYYSHAIFKETVFLFLVVYNIMYIHNIIIYGMVVYHFYYFFAIEHFNRVAG